MFIFQSNGYPQENYQTDVSAAKTIGKSNMFDYRICPTDMRAPRRNITPIGHDEWDDMV